MTIDLEAIRKRWVDTGYGPDHPDYGLSAAERMDRRASYAIQDVPDLIAEVEQLRAERAAVRASLGDFYVALRDEGGNDTGESFYLDQGAHIAAGEWRRSQEQMAEMLAEVERLRVQLEECDAERQELRGRTVSLVAEMRLYHDELQACRHTVDVMDEHHRLHHDGETA